MGARVQTIAVVAWGLVWFCSGVAGAASAVGNAVLGTRGALPSPSGPGNAERAASMQEQYDARADARLSSGFGVDGAAVVRATAGDLEVAKTVAPDGTFRLRLRRGSDQLVFQGNHAAIEIMRGNKTLKLDVGSASEEDYLRVRALLAGSRAVRRLRVLAASLDPATEQTPAGMSLLLADAVVGLLDGDVAAVHRLAQRFGRKPAVLRLASLGEGCYQIYESEVVGAWDDYGACIGSVGYYSAWGDACSFRWILWVESSWFSFLGCSALPIGRN